MLADNNTVIQCLNNLINVCKDGENGYQTAAGCVTNQDLRALFQSYAEQRKTYAAELQGEVKRLGGKPADGGSFTGTMHRAWTKIKSLVGSDEHAIIAECERGEDTARDAYAEALKQELPAHIQALLERQFAGIKEAHDRVHSLEMATSK